MNNTMLMNTTYGKNGKGQGDTIHGTLFSLQLLIFTVIFILYISSFLDVSNKLTSTIYGLSNDNHRKPLTYVRTPYTGKNVYINIMNSCLCFLIIRTFF